MRRKITIKNLFLFTATVVLLIIASEALLEIAYAGGTPILNQTASSQNIEDQDDTPPPQEGDGVPIPPDGAHYQDAPEIANKGELDSLADKYKESPWQVLATSLATFISMLAGLYPIFIKGVESREVRQKEWGRAITIACGMALLVTGAWNFYEQQTPPHDYVLQEVYDGLHGYCSSRWTSSWGPGPVMHETPNYSITSMSVRFDNDNTYIKYHGQCFSSDKCNPFVAPGISVGESKLFRSLKSDHMVSDGQIKGFLMFPSVAYRCGDIYLWEDRSKAEYFEQNGHLNTLNASIRLSNDSRSTGTNVWGFLAMLGIGLLIFGIGGSWPFSHK